ncbi:hypothetical protein BDN70DRAFT_897853 [Pholiota conissans]|uniref:Uncharacterized protein n=1 Tax=Pholiota conissans TaxID=109636 RepID=A0A9P6CWM8_9AGAR|nr:hypothetical protein BDN70DRAFT_897853 [Pholiota conissans]
MSGYSILSKESPDLGEDAQDNGPLLGRDDSASEAPISPVDKKLVPIYSIVGAIIFLVILNVALGFANIWATHTIGAMYHATEIMPVEKLPRADQYRGLGKLSREYCPWYWKWKRAMNLAFRNYENVPKVYLEHTSLDNKIILGDAYASIYNKPGAGYVVVSHPTSTEMCIARSILNRDPVGEMGTPFLILSGESYGALGLPFP